MEIITTLFERYNSMPRIDKITKKPVKITTEELKLYKNYLKHNSIDYNNKFKGHELQVIDSIIDVLEMQISNEHILLTKNEYIEYLNLHFNKTNFNIALEPIKEYKGKKILITKYD